LSPVEALAIAHNFMLQDLLGSLLAVLAFTFVFYTPGYVVAFAMDLYSFRKMGFAERSLWAIAASFCVTPIFAHLVGRGAGVSGICWLLIALAISSLLLLLRRSEGSTWSRHDQWFTALVVLGWTAFALLMLVDLQVGHKLYFSTVLADQSYRVAFTDTVMRTGVPPANPLYYGGSPGPMRYYYFWYVLCGAVAKMAHVSARQSFIASSIWAGFGLLVTIKLYARHFFHWGRRQTWIALGLLFVMGADLVPSLGNAILQRSLNGDIEWWSVDPIDGWPDSLLWVPHHVASVFCCLIAFLLLRRTTEEPLGKKFWPVVLAGVAFASAFGLSIWVAFGFALLMCAWLLWIAVKRHPDFRGLLLRVMCAGLLSAALLTPFLVELASSLAHTASSSSTNTPAHTHMFSLSVRKIIDSGLLTDLPLFTALNRSHPVLLDQALRILLLLPGLAMELGLYGAVLVLLLLAQHRKTLPADDARDTALFFTISGLAMTLFLSSSVINNNDFGYRAVMLPQFFLLLLTADVLGSWSNPESAPVIAATPARRRLLYSLLALGVAGSVYGSCLLRLWLPLVATNAQSGFGPLPQEAFEIRQAFVVLDRVAPKDAVVAFRPLNPNVDRNDAVITPNEFYQRLLVTNAGRQMLNAEPKCAIQFGGDPAACPEIRTATEQLYASPSPTADWARDYCSRFGVQYLLIGHRDSNWDSNSGWAVTLPEIAKQPDFKIFQCGTPQN
jgi:hypothetical protein